MDNYIVSLWPGSGYLLEQIKVQATCEDEALEAAMCFCQKNGLKYLYVDAEEVNACDLSDDEKEEIWYYVDPTMYDPDYIPAYFWLENIGVEKVD